MESGAGLGAGDRKSGKDEEHRGGKAQRKGAEKRAFIHGNEVKSGDHPVVCGVGFLENIFHFMQNSAHAKTPQKRSDPRSARHQTKRKSAQSLSRDRVLVPKRGQTCAVKSKNLLARQVDNGRIFRAGAHANATTRWGGLSRRHKGTEGAE